MEVFITWLFVS